MKAITREDFFEVIRDGLIFNTGHSEEFQKGALYGAQCTLNTIDQGGCTILDVDESAINPTHSEGGALMGDNFRAWVDSINS